MAGGGEKRRRYGFGPPHKTPYTALDKWCPRCHRIHSGPHAGQQSAERIQNTAQEVCPQCEESQRRSEQREAYERGLRGKQEGEG